MKIATIAAALLLLGVPHSGSCSVQVGPPMKSSQHIAITTIFDGKPRKDVKVEIYMYRKGAVNLGATLVTGEDGSVALPLLAPGEYCIVASTDLDLRSDLCLRVVPHSKKEKSAFSMELLVTPFPTWEQQLAAAERLPVRVRLQAFSGVVRDPSGSPIQSVVVQIIRKGSQGKGRVAQFESDKDGRFSSDLADGAYIAVFSAPGFSTQLVPLEISQTRGGGDLRIALAIAAATQ